MELRVLLLRRGITKDENDGVTSEKHFADKTFFVDCLLSLSCRGLCPHLLHILQDHITMTIVRLHARQQLVIVPHVDQHLRIALHALLQNGKGTSLTIILLFIF